MKEKYKQDFLKAGALAREVRAYGKSLIQNGSLYNEVIKKIKSKIVELGAKEAFPPQIAFDDVAAHFLPAIGQNLIFLNQVVKLDVGICYNGAIGDCAVTIDLSGKHQRLIDATEKALLEAEKIVKVGLKVSEIGRVIEETITSFGFQPIRNLSGHGLGYYKIHTEPHIPNYDDQSEETIKPGMTFAIEPFATNGKGLIYESGIPTIFSFLKMRPIKSQSARQLLPLIREFEGLPFSIHDLPPGSEQGLIDLVKADVIGGYPALVELGHGMVAQAENSILVDEQGQVFVSTR